jgi:hypothetical protein
MGKWNLKSGSLARTLSANLWQARTIRKADNPCPVRKLDCSGRTAEKDASIGIRESEGGDMKISMKVTGATKLTEDRLLVQL